MKFVVKHFVRLVLFLVLAVVAYEIYLANNHLYKKGNYGDARTAALDHLAATIEAINFTVQTTWQCQWSNFALMRKISFLFFNRIYWLAAGLLLLILYYELRSRQATPDEIFSTKKISPDEHRK
jgi:hypothetical protein